MIKLLRTVSMYKIAGYKTATKFVRNLIMNRDAVVYAHVGLFKQDVQLAVQNQIGISKRVIVDQIIQL